MNLKIRYHCGWPLKLIHSFSIEILQLEILIEWQKTDATGAIAVATFGGTINPRK